jgi:hypothetical protein
MGETEVELELELEGVNDGKWWVRQGRYGESGGKTSTCRAQGGLQVT